jgi:thiol-disulfide isomerase/thioredoxin
MGKASRSKRDTSARQQKIAAQRAAARRVEIRNRVLLASGAILAVIVVVVAFIVVKANSDSKSSTAGGASNGPTGTALASVVKDVTSVPASTLNSVGAGSTTAFPTTISGTALTANGKPEMLYMGAEYCPYCAAERWAMVVALSRFGTFSGLKTVHSSTTDTPSNIPTWTFYGSTYTSKYLTFTPVETLTNIPDTKSAAGYTALQTPTAAETAVETKFDSTGNIPFIDFGNKYQISGASYSPTLIEPLTWSQIAASLSNPSSSVAKAIDGTANYITAAICALPNVQSASACTSSVVQNLETKI